MVGRRRFERGEPGGDCALLGMVQVFFHHRGHRGHRDFCREGVDSRSVGLARCSGWYRFFHHRGTEVTEIFCGGKAPIRGQWEWRFVGGGRGFFHHRGHRGHRDFYGGKASIRAWRTWWRLRIVAGGTVVFHHRGTEGTEIFYGGRARIRGQWELRFVGGGRFFFTTEAQRAQRFLVRARRFEGSGYGALLGVVGFFHHRGTEGTEIFGKSAPIRGQWVWGAVGGGTVFFHHKDTKSTKIFMVGRRRFERGESGGNGALSRVVNLVAIAHCRGRYRFFHHKDTVTRQNTRIP